MKSRILQLINNFYYDKEENKEEDWVGEFCVFGYYDGLRILEKSDSNQLVGELSNDKAVETLNGHFNVRNVGCVCLDEKKEEAFWEVAANCPFLFVSMVRLKSDARNTWKTQIAEWNADEKTISYFSFDHNEVILLFLQEKYSDGLKKLIELIKNKNVLRMYSIVAVKEEILKSEEQIEKFVRDENITVRLNVTVKNVDNLEQFMQCLLVKLGKMKPEEERTEVGKYCKQFAILGSEDLSIEVEDVPMHKILKCYAMGEILTHVNATYQNTFYNVKTSFLKEFRWDEE